MRLCARSDTATASCATVISGPSALARKPPVRCSGAATSAMKTLRQSTGSPARAGGTSPTYRMVLGKFSRKTRGSISAESRVAIMRSIIFVLSRNESGARRSDENAARPVAKLANSSTGKITLRLEMPVARMAMISPSLAMRPRPIRMPTSIPKGMVQGKKREDGGRRAAATHQHVEDPVHAVKKDDERGQEGGEESAGEDLAKNVA